MNGLFNIDSKPMIFLAHIGDLILLNLLWLLTSLPIVTLGASTTALYSVLIDFDQREILSGGIFHRYFSSFRCNFRQSTLVFLILLVPLVILLLDVVGSVTGLVQNASLWLTLLILPGIIWLVIWSYSFPLIAIFENSIRQTMKNLVLIAIANLPLTVVICALNAIPFLLVWFFPFYAIRSTPFWLFLGFALIAKCNSVLFGKIFSRLVTAREDQEEDPAAVE